ncbi:MAG: prepilin-type N-terminal cleavage/methylation domain-containing protein [Spirochaetes bacterium]|nr:prepilin-type N-terminal cleavage/methylation domain-containing protein [Spirochaetota bacterium]
MRSTSRRGFTVAETLVALAAGAVLMTVLFTLFTIAVRMNDTVSLRAREKLLRMRLHNTCAEVFADATNVIMRGNELTAAFVTGQTAVIILENKTLSCRRRKPGTLTEFTVTTLATNVNGFRLEQLPGRINRVAVIANIGGQTIRRTYTLLPVQ